MAVVFDAPTKPKVVYDEEPAAAPPALNTPSALNRSANDVITGTLDLFGNAPTNVANLAKAAVSVPLVAMGKPEWAPEPSPEPNYARRAARALGIPDDQTDPRTYTAAQKVGKRATEFGTAMLMGGAPRVANALAQTGRQVGTGAGIGAASSLVEQGTNSPELGMITALALPVAGAIPTAAKSRLQRLAVTREQRDAVAARGRQNGFVAPPAATNPESKINAVAETVGGRSQLAGDAANRNAVRVQEVAAESLGVPVRDLTPRTLQRIREVEGRVYEELKRQAPVVVDEYYTTAVNNLGEIPETLARQFPRSSQVPRRVQNLITDMQSQNTISAEAAVLKIQRLRKDANAYYKAAQNNPDPEKLALADLNKRAANLLEDLMERTLTQRGNNTLLDRFKEARVRIATAHDVENAMNRATNEVDAMYFAQRFDEGAPLNPQLASIGEFALAFPEAMATTRSANALPFVERMGAYKVAGGSPAGVPAAAAMAASPAFVRNWMLSEPWQRFLGQSSLQDKSRRIAEALERNKRAAPLIAVQQGQE